MTDHDPSPELVDFVQRVASELAPSHEQRQYPRHTFTVPVDVQPLDNQFKPSGESFVAVTRDLSAVGIGILHTRAIKAKYLLVTIQARGGPKKVTVEVRRCSTIGKFYDIGGRFVRRGSHEQTTTTALGAAAQSSQ